MRTTAAILCAVTSVTAIAAAAPVAGTVTRWNVGAWTVWRIERPAAGDYPDVQFQAGDQVVLDAGGCGLAVQVSIPGPTTGPVAVREILRQGRRVGTAAPLAVAGGCERGQDGWMMIGVHHAADDPLPLPRPMDLVSNGSVDANGIALNPQWGLQQICGWARRAC